MMSYFLKNNTEKTPKKVLTSQLFCDKIVNCIIIAWYAFFFGGAAVLAFFTAGGKPAPKGHSRPLAEKSTKRA
jgi:hypothetical protein